MKVLVVDDDDIVLELTTNMLIESGYEVDTASNGEQALEMLRTGAYRLVVSDWVMPEMTGFELCQAVRSRLYGRYIYFILVTSRDATDDIVSALDAGADDFITKPVNPAELCVRLRAGERILSLENRDVTILALAKIAESRDPETGAHLERMREYCRILAQDLATRDEFCDKIDGEYIDAIYSTSPLHDIGKVGIPDNILLSTERYTIEEYEQMKKHTLIGAESLDATMLAHPEAQFLQMAKEIALTHHERWDGTGYPHGLSGREIPLCGRIVALADVYDALTSKRSYKPAYSHEKVKSMIIEGSGTQFDPAIVDSFLRNEHRFNETHIRFKESESNHAVTSSV